MQKNIQIEERDFFKEPFAAAEIKGILTGQSAIDMFNFRSPSFSKLGLDRDKLTEDELIELMIKEPRLVRRPVIRIGKDVHFGADAKSLQAILS